MSNERFPNWVPNDTVGNRKDTATLLVGTAKESGLEVRHHIASTAGGFYITDALADLVYEDSDDADSGTSTSTSTSTSTPDTDPEPKAPAKKKSAKKTSGNRAAKNTDS